MGSRLRAAATVIVAHGRDARKIALIPERIFGPERRLASGAEHATRAAITACGAAARSVGSAARKRSASGEAGRTDAAQ